MSRIDENGVRHPSGSDLIDERVKIHMAYCLECNPYALSKSQNIVTPCHGVPLDVSYDGVTIYCSEAYCINEWGTDGILNT